MNRRRGRKMLAAAAMLGASVLMTVGIGASIAGARAKTLNCPKAAPKAWSFGVMGDTQWTCPTDPAGTNPNSVSASIISQVNQQFINKGVKFVIQVGDLTDNGSDAGIAARAAAAQLLLDAGIGFFPMRGNHETYGTNNSFGIPAFQAAFPQTQGLSDTFGAKHFSSPTSVSTDLKGMSYSFDYGTPGNNARFVILDNWVTPSKDIAAADYDYGYSFGDQQSWISSRLNKNTRGTVQAFVFSHQPLIAESHQDSPFVGYTDANPAMQNAFLASLQANRVRYYICGHDHIGQRSIIASPDGKSKVQEIIDASCSSKFYTPTALNDPNWFGQKSRETSVSQDLYRVGFYIYTVDGPNVTVDYYADDHGNWLSSASYPSGPSGAGSQITPTFHFVKRATWGYSLNGKEFVVGGGATNGTNNDPSYTVVKDSFCDTSARILSGAYANTATDYTGRVLAQTVDTGWMRVRGCDDLESSVLRLWGMTGLGSSQTDTYVLSMTSRRCDHQFGILVTRKAHEGWVNAVDKNTSGTKHFVVGPWKSTYGLGTFGFDPHSHTAWAVVNHGGSFAVAEGWRS